MLIDEDGSEAPRWYRTALKGADAFSRTREVRFWKFDWTENHWDDVIAIGIEDPAGNHGTNYLYRVQGAILARLPKDTLVQPWRPSQWRKAVGLPGNCPKSEIAIWAVREYPMQGLAEWPQDAFDALGIALATKQAISVGKAA